MKSDSMASALIAAVPAWAQETAPTHVRARTTYTATAMPLNSYTSAQILLRIDETAAILKVSSKTVQRLLARGDLRAVRIGRLVRIPSAEIDRLIAVACPSGDDFENGGDRV